MTESEDPWANHIRGMAPTPLEEGSDPLSMMMPSSSTSAAVTTPMQSTPITTKMTDGRRAPFARKESDLLEAKWGNSRSDAGADESDQSMSSVVQNGGLSSKGQDEGESMRRVIEKGIVNSNHRITEDEADADEEGEQESFVYPKGRETADSKEGDVSQDAFAYSRGSPAEREEEGSVGQLPPAAQVTSPSDTDGIAARSIEHEARPIDHARLSHLCTQGPLSALQSFFTVTVSPAPAGSGISAFALANEPNPHSGLVPIHYAAREGRVEILKWLISEAGALVEMEDKEGETALHKSALAGKLPAMTLLLSSGADANSKDGDGWTALHNACSRGFLDIVKVLVESAGAQVDVKGGRGAWTPLMNASSHGHLPIVRYLSSKHHADPFVRNAAGETAYDVAAATFEVYICDTLQRYEAEVWGALKFASPSDGVEGASGTAPTKGPYNPLSLHTTIPVVLHENQRLDTRLSTLAIRGGKPRWSGTQAGRTDKADRRAPSTMPPGPLSLSRSRNIPMRRSDVVLPDRAEPYKIKLANRITQMAAARRLRGEPVEDELASTPTPDSIMNNARIHSTNSAARRRGTESSQADESSHFWLSDWQPDLTHPQVDAEQGWQYSQTFDAVEERWLAAPPPPLTRLLEGRGLGQNVQRAVTGTILGTNDQPAAGEAEAVSTGWVRRRRWVRVMRRRLDIEFGDELEEAEQASTDLVAAVAAGSTAESTRRAESRDRLLISSSVYEAQQAAQSDAEALGPSADYLAKSQAIAGTVIDMTAVPAAQISEDDLKTCITRLDLAVAELRSFAFTDDDTERQGRAEELLKRFTLQAGQLRQAAGLEAGSEDEGDDDDNDAEFIYPNSYKDDGQSVITRLGTPSVTTNGIVPPRQRSSPSEVGTSIGATRSADLANAADFRVPTNEVPNRPALETRHSLREQILLPTWENDGDVASCKGCHRKFTFFLRKHHCRRCGRIYCDSCSSHRVQLPPDEIVIDPGVPEMIVSEASGPTRICDSCDAERRLPSTIRNSRGVDALSQAVDRMGMHRDDSGLSDVSSRASELNECPVCNTVLANLGDSALQEEHVRLCLENGGGGSVQGGRYLIYKLAEGPIVGKECQICLEDLCVGMTIARLPCLCYYHRHCIDSWFSRGRSCPVHARSW